MSIYSSIVYLSLLAVPAAAFWRLPCKSTLVVERADPIVNPGNVSGHVHQIMGGNGFDFEMDYADTQSSTCSSCTVIGDNSLYWTPVLYYQHQDGSFEKVNQVGGGLVYYLQRKGSNSEKLKAFPAGFRMISGDPFRRSGGSDFASQAISYNCLDYNKNPGNPETGVFPNMNCPNGLRTQVFFPSCWDGKNLDSTDHKSHVAFPVDAYNNGKCPDSHPVHLISIFYEIIWDTNKFKDMWYGNSQPFVWANGDPTGTSFHGDFLNGWDVDLLQRATDECTNESGRVEDCPVFKLRPDAVAEGCKLASKVNEDVQGPFSKLPGCNPVQKGPERAQLIKTCEGNSATIGESKPFFRDLSSQGWSYQGCGADNYYARALKGASTSQAGMTNEQCVKFCGDKGFSVAGTEYSKECYCGSSIPASAQPVNGVVGNCNMPCDGDKDQFCGGSGLLSLYTRCASGACNNAVGVGGSKAINTSTSTPSAVKTTTTGSTLSRAPTSSQASKTSTTSAVTSTTPLTPSSVQSSTLIASGLPSNWSYLNCIVDNINPRTLPKLAPYVLNNKPVTSLSCVSYCSSQGYAFAGTEYGGECFCGNTIPAGTKKLDESKCSMSCKGDGGQKCGGPAALSLFGDLGKVNTLSLTKRDAAVEAAQGVKDHILQHRGKRHIQRSFS